MVDEFTKCRQRAKRVGLKLVEVLVDSNERYERATEIVGRDVCWGYEATVGYYFMFIVDDDQVDRLRRGNIPFSIIDND